MERERERERGKKMTWMTEASYFRNGAFYKRAYSWRSELHQDVIKMAAIQFQFLFRAVHLALFITFKIILVAYFSSGGRLTSSSLLTLPSHSHIDVTSSDCDESIPCWSRLRSWLGRPQVQVQVQAHFYYFDWDTVIIGWIIDFHIDTESQVSES